MQNKKYPVQIWDTSNQTDRRKRRLPQTPLFSPGTKGRAKLGLSGADKGQIKVGINNWTLLHPWAVGNRQRPAARSWRAVAAPAGGRTTRQLLQTLVTLAKRPMSILPESQAGPRTCGHPCGSACLQIRCFSNRHAPSTAESIKKLSQFKKCCPN